jgi:hypothetical protein
MRSLHAYLVLLTHLHRSLSKYFPSPKLLHEPEEPFVSVVVSSTIRSSPKLLHKPEEPFVSVVEVWLRLGVDNRLELLQRFSSPVDDFHFHAWVGNSQKCKYFVLTKEHRIPILVTVLRVSITPLKPLSLILIISPHPPHQSSPSNKQVLLMLISPPYPRHQS